MTECGPSRCCPEDRSRGGSVGRARAQAVLSLVVGWCLTGSSAFGASPVEPGRFERHVVVAAATDPMQLDLAPDGRLFFIERAGVFKVWLPDTGSVVEAGRLDVGLFGEVGLMGFVLSHDFTTNPRAFVLYCPAADPDRLRVSAFPVVDDRIDTESEEVLLDYPIDKDFAVHMGGGLAMSERGELFIGTGDNTIPIPELPLDERPGHEHLDSRRSSGNTNDLRGKILRIVPQRDGGYRVPAGNLFAKGDDGRPEVYAMGCRNPFRISFDDATRTLLWGDVGPNISMEVPIGPNGYDEFNATQQPGNFGWPFFVGPNEPYRDYDFATGVLGEPFVAERPVNDSRNNTGARELPPARPAFVWYPSGVSQEFPELGSGGRSAMAGPVYRLSDAQDKELRLPEHYHDAFLIHDWTRNWIKAVWRDESGACARIEPFLPRVAFRKPIHLRLASDGTLYVIEFGDKWFDNRDAQIVRIVYRRGNRPPEPSLTASASVGKAPLEATFDANGTVDRDGEDDLRWAWKLDGELVPGATEPTLDLTLTDKGRHVVEVEVTDRHGASGTTEAVVFVGNAPPSVTLNDPLDGAFFDWGRVVKYRASVADEEDGRSEAREISDAAVVVRATYQQRRRRGPDEAVAPGLALMRKSTCFSCHSTNSSGGGPAYRLVAKRYAGASGAVRQLAEKVMRGGVGVWGKKAMPAHPNVELSDAEAMVAWVLGVANDRTQQVLSGHDGAFLAPERPPHRGDAGVLCVEAEYRDLGVEAIPSAVGTARAVLHAPRKKPAFADEVLGVEIIDVFEGEADLVGFFARGGYARFVGMRPGFASGVRVRGRSTTATPAKVELRLDRPDGELLGAVELPTDEYGEVDLSYTAPSGLHDVLIVADPSDSGAESDPIAAVSWIEFTREIDVATPTKLVVAPLATDDLSANAELQTWCDLLAKTINQLDDAVALVSPDPDWPADQRVIADSRAVVLCQRTSRSEDIDAIPPSVAEQVDLMRRLGVGVVFLQLVPAEEGDPLATAFVGRKGNASTPQLHSAEPFGSAVRWPIAGSNGDAWLAVDGEAGDHPIAWAEAPANAGRRVRFVLPPDPSTLMEPAVRGALLRAVLWASWRDADEPPATWLDPGLLQPTPTTSAELTVADYSQTVPGGWLLPPLASTSAGEVDKVFWLITGVSVACATPITLAMIGLVVAYRRGAHAEPVPSPSHNAWLEATWSVVPAIIVVGVFHAGLVGYLDLRTPPVDCYEIGVTAQKWNWSFHYPGGHVEPDLHAPAGRPVKLVMSSADVIHSVFIPAFRLKMDCVPGRYSTAWFEAKEPTPPGHSHPLYCAEYCGTNHSQMLASVIIHPANRFDAWLAEAGDLTSRMPPIEAGELLYRRRGCVQCHSTDGSRRSGGGPSFLGSFGTEQSLASGKQQVIDENYLRESILNPMAKVRAGYRPVMPSYQGQLRETEINALLAFIKSLRESETGTNGGPKP